MTEFNPQVVKIEKIEKHPNADTLSIYTVLNDYPVVDKTGKYNIGDLAGYICVDAIVPDIEQYAFLSPKEYERYEENGEIKQRAIGLKYKPGSIPEKYRIIKAKKFFGVFSMGLLVDCPPGLNLGDPLTETLSLKKWEEEEEENLPHMKRPRGANAASPPKGWSIPYYDIDGLRKYVICLKEDEDIVLTEKLNGSNSSFCHDGEKLWCKSRNFYKKFDETDMWWDLAIRYDLENKLKQYPMMVFFGECIGQVKKFRYNAEIVDGKLLTKLYFFDVYNPKTQRYLDYDDRVALITSLGLDPVPELYRGKWLGKEAMYPYAEGMTTLGGKHIREGFVLNTLKERFEPKLGSRMQVKLISQQYHLSK